MATPDCRGRCRIFPVVHTENVTAHCRVFSTSISGAAVMLKPHGKLTKHRHPNVDSYDFALSGDGELKINGIPRRLPVKVRARDWHEGEAGPEGFVFLSVQEFLNGKTPCDIGLDTEGEALDSPRRRNCLNAIFVFKLLLGLKGWTTQRY